MSNIESSSDVVLTRYWSPPGVPATHRVQWCRNGYCYVVRLRSGDLLGAFVDGRWIDDADLPGAVREYAMLVRPV
jgi:hypothetical protein